MNPSDGRRQTLVLLGGTAVSIAILLANAWPNLPTTVDDAWITARYAAHLADGHGLTYSTGEPPVEGYTNLLWTLFVAAGLALGASVQALLVWGGLAFGALTLACVTGLTATVARTRHPVVLAAPLFLALVPQLAVAVTNGLETAMWLAGLVASAWALFAARGAGRLGAGALVAVLGAIRPEGLAVSWLLIGADLLRRRDRLGRPSTWLPAGVTVAAQLALFGWRWLTYGALVPNTFHAKANLELAELTRRNLRYIHMDGPLWEGIAALLVIALVVRPRRLERLALGAVAALIAATAWSVQMWMPGARLLLPVVVLFAVVAASLLADRGGRRAAGGAAALGLIGALLLLTPIEDAVRRYDRVHSVLPGNATRTAAEHLREHVPPGSWLAVRDAGVFAYHVGTGLRVAETHDRALTRVHDDGADIRVEDFVPENPEIIVGTLAEVEGASPKYRNDRRVLRRTTVPYDYLGRVKQHHRRYYDVWVRSDLDVPPLPERIVVNRNGERFLSRR